MSIWDTYKTRRLNNPRWWLTVPVFLVMMSLILILMPLFFIVDIFAGILKKAQDFGVWFARSLKSIGIRLSKWTYENHPERSTD